ncbi:hypothetical protein VBM90_00435 [Mycoplasma sp. 2704]|nr:MULTISPECIES: hypothetical protein [unclassified Mycoplasma]MEA4134276.1 hypothetical protein [Mycoplasma sp. 2704]
MTIDGLINKAQIFASKRKTVADFIARIIPTIRFKKRCRCIN